MGKNPIRFFLLNWREKDSFLLFYNNIHRENLNWLSWLEDHHVEDATSSMVANTLTQGRHGGARPTRKADSGTATRWRRGARKRTGAAIVEEHDVGSHRILRFRWAQPATAALAR
jgi:hypothetical protein